MGQQFNNVSSRYGAPMGRSESPLGHSRVRLFRVRINRGGYDDGGAYWGIGKPLYCAECAEGGRRFIRADSRLQAVAELGIEARDMVRPPLKEYARLRNLEHRGGISARGVVLLQRLQELGF